LRGVSGGVDCADPRRKRKRDHDRELQPGRQPIHPLLYTGEQRPAGFLCARVPRQRLYREASTSKAALSLCVVPLKVSWPSTRTFYYRPPRSNSQA
jgi:hypothetical protein